MFFLQKIRASSILLIGAAVASGAACNSTGENAAAPSGLVVVNASRTGTVRRILLREGMNVAENAVIIEIAVPSGDSGATANVNRPTIGVQAPNQAKINADAEQEVQRAAVELQRIEPLVASGGAPQAHLDAARAAYQQAQERRDQLRRTAQNPQSNPVLQQNSENPGQNAAPAENIVAVRTPVAGNIRVISARVGQSVKAGEPIATVSTAR